MNNAVTRALKRVRRAAVDTVVPRAVFMLRGKRVSGRRRAALTFDDGPHVLTRAYLDVLGRHHARATFFLIGDHCVRRPDDVRAIADAGHEVGSHGFSHARWPRLGRQRLDAELSRTEALLPARAGRPLLRPPNGVIDVGTLVACATSGRTTVHWSLDTLDYRKTEPAVLAARMGPGVVEDGEVILLHEGKPWTLAALDLALPRLRDAGVELVTVGELLGA